MKKLLSWGLALFVGSTIAAAPGTLIIIGREGEPVKYYRRHVETPIVAPGDILRIKIAADIYKQCDSTVYRSITDSTGVVFEIAPGKRRDETEYTVAVPVPLGAAEGPATYKARIEWRCNFVQQFYPNVVNQNPLAFTIKAGEYQLQIPEKQGVYEKKQDRSDLAGATPE